MLFSFFAVRLFREQGGVISEVLQGQFPSESKLTHTFPELAGQHSNRAVQQFLEAVGFRAK